MIDAKTRGIEVRKKMLKAIVDYIQEHGYSPSVREIADMVGLKSTSSVKVHLDTMLHLGMIETDASWGSPRAIRVPGYKFVKEQENDNIKDI